MSSGIFNSFSRFYRNTSYGGILSVILLIIIFMVAYALYDNYYSPSKNRHEPKPLDVNIDDSDDIKQEIVYEVPILAQPDESLDELFLLARTYRFGLDENETYKNKIKALRVYQYLIDVGDDIQKAEARHLFIETLEESRLENLQVPRQQRINDTNEVEEQLSNYERRRPKIRKPKFQKRTIRTIKLRNPQRKPNLINDILSREENPRNRLPNVPTRQVNIEPPRRQIVRIIIPEVRPEPRIRPDDQNVHDSMVVRSTKNSIDKLEELTATAGNEEPLDASLQELKQALKERNQPFAIETLEKMIHTNESISSFDKTESQILKMVWDRINHPDNKERKNDMLDILGDQLKDARTVCAMGRATRALQSLEGTDTTETIKIQPKWAVREEVQNTTSKIYQETLAAVPEEMRIATTVDSDTATADQVKLYEEFKTKYSENLTNKLKDDYVKTGFMTEESIAAEVKTAMEALV